MAAGKQKIHMVSNHPSTDYVQKEKNVPLQVKVPAITTSSKWWSLSPTKSEKLTLWHHLLWNVAKNYLNQIKPWGSNQTNSECETTGLDSSKKKKSMSQITNKKRQGTILNERWMRQNNQMQSMNLEGTLDWNLVWTKYWVINWVIINFV